MDISTEILLTDEKFKSVSTLREFLCEIENLDYCSFGSFLSAIHFQRAFKTPFDLLVRDELEAIDFLSKNYKVDQLHGTLTLGEDQDSESKNAFKIRLIDATAKNENVRQYLIKHSDFRSCVVTNSIGEVEKFELKIPRRGPTLIALLLENDGSPENTCSIVEKIIWSLNNVGVAPLLRESRFIDKEAIYQSADIVDDLFVSHANKTASLLHSQGLSDFRSISSTDLKKLGRPFAALLRA